MRRVIITIILLTGIFWIPCRAGEQPYDPPHVTDNFDILLGSNMRTCLGERALFVPISISVSQPTILVNLIISYDNTVITPTILAPNIFFQSFTYDLSIPGRIKVAMITDLPPPPYVPPVYGDTILAWISFRITTRDLLFNFRTYLGFYEDPTTPYPDNFIVKNDNDRVVPPYLDLHMGDILLEHPLYGDINLNTYPFEIADAVLFVNYLVGRAQLTQCQIANADCNRDGIQASIADLVYMIAEINYDSTLLKDSPDMPIGGVAWKPSGIPAEDQLMPLADRSYDVMIQNDVPLGGASFEITLADSATIPDVIVLDTAAQYMQMYCAIDRNILRVTIVNWDLANDSFRGGRLFSVKFAGVTPIPPFTIDNADFSDNRGQKISPNYQIGGADQHGEIISPEPVLAISGYPNPFKKTISLSFDLPNNGRRQLAVYDILGRKVKTLLDGYGPAGSGQILWDGRDEVGGELASGTYFVRLQESDKSRTLKLFFLK